MADAREDVYLNTVNSQVEEDKSPNVSCCLTDDLVYIPLGSTVIYLNLDPKKAVNPLTKICPYYQFMI